MSADWSFHTSQHASGAGDCHCHTSIFRCRRNDEYVTRQQQQQLTRTTGARPLQNSCYLYFRRVESSRGEKAGWLGRFAMYRGSGDGDGGGDGGAVSMFTETCDNWTATYSAPINLFDSLPLVAAQSSSLKASHVCRRRRQRAKPAFRRYRRYTAVGVGWYSSCGCTLPLSCRRPQLGNCRSSQNHLVASRLQRKVPFRVSLSNPATTPGFVASVE